MAATLKAAKDKVLTVALINNIIQDSPRDPGGCVGRNQRCHTCMTQIKSLGFLRFWRNRNAQHNICGRHYVLRSEIARFNSRALAGEFSKPCARPPTRSVER